MIKGIKPLKRRELTLAEKLHRFFGGWKKAKPA